jgi:hypothetical protein
MKNVQLSLPDDLARDAAAAGLLSDANLEHLLREAMRALRKDNLRNAMVRMAASPVEPAMSPEDVAAEIAAFRAESRVQKPAR